jgi:SAM-dependent methyltransferase
LARSLVDAMLNWLVYKIHDGHLMKVAQQYASGRLVDIGCGTKPYMDLFAPYVIAHIGVDHPGTIHARLHVNIFGTAYQIPVLGSFFDTAICTAVLEHLEEPEEALAECFRVLKPGGIAIYSVPFIWHLHEEPRDFFRFSKYGLDYLFTKVGFKIVELNALSGFWVTFGQLLVYNLYRLNRGPIRWLHLLDIPGFLVQVIAYLLDRLDKTEQWTWMYMVVARKP